MRGFAVRERSSSLPAPVLAQQLAVLNARSAAPPSPLASSSSPPPPSSSPSLSPPAASPGSSLPPNFSVRDLVAKRPSPAEQNANALPDNFSVRDLVGTPDAPDAPKRMYGLLWQHSSSSMKSWKKRWATLDARTLTIFESKGAAKVRATVDVGPYFVKPEVRGKYSREAVFSLAAPDGEMLTFAAPSLPDMNEWVAALSRVARNSDFDAAAAAPLADALASPRATAPLPSATSPAPSPRDDAEALLSPRTALVRDASGSSLASDDAEAGPSAGAAEGDGIRPGAGLLLSLARSERAYLVHLTAIIEVWYKPLKATPLPIVTDDQFRIMLSCVDAIHARTTVFVDALDAAAAAHGLEAPGAELTADADVLAAYVDACLDALDAHGSPAASPPLGVLYAKYVVDQLSLDTLIPNLEEDSMIFKGFMLDAHTNKLCSGMEFAELARFAPRRIREYPLLLRALASTMGGPALAPRLRALVDCFQAISADVQRAEDSGARANEVFSALTFPSELDNLLTDASLFVTDAAVKVASNADAPKFADAVLVVFTDVVFVCTRKKAELVVDAALAVRSTRVSELPPMKKAKHVLALADNRSDTTIIVRSSSFANHTAILRDLRATISAMEAST